jgi:hypothetical protein
MSMYYRFGIVMKLLYVVWVTSSCSTYLVFVCLKERNVDFFESSKNVCIIQ